MGLLFKLNTSLNSIFEPVSYLIKSVFRGLLLLLSIGLLISCVSTTPFKQNLEDINFPRLKRHDLPEGHIRTSYATGSEGRLTLKEDGCLYFKKRDLSYLILWPEEMKLETEGDKLVVSHTEFNPDFQRVIVGEKVYFGGVKTHLNENSVKRLSLYSLIGFTHESLRSSCNTNGFFPIRSSKPAT